MSDLYNDIDDNISPTESEAHAIRVVGVIVVVVARRVDIVEVVGIVDIRRTQPHKASQLQTENIYRMSPIPKITLNAYILPYLFSLSLLAISVQN